MVAVRTERQTEYARRVPGDGELTLAGLRVPTANLSRHPLAASFVNAAAGGQPLAVGPKGDDAYIAARRENLAGRAGGHVVDLAPHGPRDHHQAQTDKEQHENERPLVEPPLLDWRRRQQGVRRGVRPGNSLLPVTVPAAVGQSPKRRAAFVAANLFAVRDVAFGSMATDWADHFHGCLPKA